MPIFLVDKSARKYRTETCNNEIKFSGVDGVHAYPSISTTRPRQNDLKIDQRRISFVAIKIDAVDLLQMPNLIASHRVVVTHIVGREARLPHVLV